MQAVPEGSSVILYDFTDPDDYDVNDDRPQSLDCTGSSNDRLWKRDSKKSKEGKLPCLRLISSKGKVVERSDVAASGVGGPGGGEEEEEWAEHPTVSVLLESLGKVRTGSLNVIMGCRVFCLLKYCVILHCGSCLRFALS